MVVRYIVYEKGEQSYVLLLMTYCAKCLPISNPDSAQGRLAAGRVDTKHWQFTRQGSLGHVKPRLPVNSVTLFEFANTSCCLHASLICCSRRLDSIPLSA